MTTWGCGGTTQKKSQYVISLMMRTIRQMEYLDCWLFSSFILFILFYIDTLGQQEDNY